MACAACTVEPTTISVAPTMSVSLTTPRVVPTIPAFSPPVTPWVAPERTLSPLPKPIDDHYAPPDVPACKNAESLRETIKVDWENVQDVMESAPDNQWTFYRCAQSQPSLSAFYRQWLVAPEYSWLETRWEERATGTLAVYNNSLVSPTHSYRWLYVWFLPDKSDANVSYLIAAWWNAPHVC